MHPRDYWRSPSDGKADLPLAPPKVIPKPPRQRQPEDLAAKGKALAGKLGCQSCHGGDLVISGKGRIPDLRTMPESFYQLMPQIIQGGLYRSLGMPQFPSVTDEQIKELQAYIVNEAWSAYQGPAHIRKDTQTQ